MHQTPFFSIITVTLDNLPGLQATDRSLKLQSFLDFEWIVMDGGSADGTRSFLEHSSAAWISRPGPEKDAAFSGSMNLGLARANGDYILFLNAGDQLAYANTLARLRNFIRSEPAPPDFIYGDWLEDGEYKSARPPEHLRRGMFTQHQSMVFRRGSLSGLSYDTRYDIAADYDFTAQMLQRSKNISYFPLPVCAPQKRSIMQHETAAGLTEQFLVRKRLKIAGLFENITTFLLQHAAEIMRRLTRPASQKCTKSSANNKPGFAQG